MLVDEQISIRLLSLSSGSTCTPAPQILPLSKSSSECVVAIIWSPSSRESHLAQGNLQQRVISWWQSLTYVAGLKRDQSEITSWKQDKRTNYLMTTDQTRMSVDDLPMLRSQSCLESRSRFPEEGPAYHCPCLRLMFLTVIPSHLIKQFEQSSISCKETVLNKTTAYKVFF